MAENYLFTSESVSCGHPDKICDQISDAILDEFLKQDSESKVAVECFITDNMLVIGGEVHSNATVDIIGTAKKVLEEIGYDGSNGFNPESAVFINKIHEQSSDIRQGVEISEEEQGAGDQGLMFGYANNDTYSYMPAAIELANRTMCIYDALRKAGKLPHCRPDAKCQYTVEYDENNNPVKVKTVLLSAQHDDVDNMDKTIRKYWNSLIFPILTIELSELSYLFTDFNEDTDLLINPTGRFVIGGPEGDTGLTGRKITVDTYGGKCPHGGGAFSGKDCSKVDRSAAYAARYIAKNIVAAGIATEVTVQLSYAIGLAEPLSIYIDAKNSFFSNSELVKMVKDIFPLKPLDIINKFNLKSPVFKSTSTYGHFGNIGVAYEWEKIDMGDIITKYLENHF